MNKQLPTILAIATLMVLNLSGCKKAEKKENEWGRNDNINYTSAIININNNQVCGTF